MKLDEFIKTFLPNFDEKWNEASSRFKSSQMLELLSITFTFDHFEEALENFTNKICEKQKEICTNDLDVFFRIQSIITYESIKEVVSNSITPKIEDL